MLYIVRQSLGNLQDPFHPRELSLPFCLIEDTTAGPTRLRVMGTRCLSVPRNVPRRVDIMSGYRVMPV